MGVQLEEPETDDPSYTFMGYNTLSVARLRCLPAHATGACAKRTPLSRAHRAAGMAVARGTSPRC